MANATQTLITSNAPALQRVRALLALMLQLVCNPSRSTELARICAEAERLLARHIFDLVIRLSGRDDLRDTHEPVLRFRSGALAFGLRRKPAALHPHHRIILSRRRANALQLCRTARGCRSRCSSKTSRVRFANQRRRQRARTTSRRAACAPPSHTPARISAPP